MSNRQSATLPSGTVTFLFTDIEGSTRLWQAHPSAMPDALARHNTIVQQAIEQHGGHVFQVIGDAFNAAFASADDALSAAVAAQRALQHEHWGETGPLRVRMGLHSGHAETRDGEYLSSPTLIRVQRCMAAGHGGQVLMTAAVQELVRDSLPAQVQLKDMGAHRLKDLVRPEQLFQLLAPDLRADFPPLRTLDAQPNNLPVQLTSFIGREHDVAEVKRLLATTRLLTLTGVGGTGKTRLALQVATDLLDTFADGVWLVELASLSEAALVPQAVTAALGVREQTGRTLSDTLTDYLRAKHVLLVFDNCEHVVGACAQLAETLLRTGAHLKILATSREVMGITGERTWYVPSLSAPHPHHMPSDADAQALLSELSRYEAVRLFVDRAVAVQPSFRLSVQNAQAVARICHQLDGIPLAVELAAARLKALSIEQIAARLDDRFNLLTVGSRTALPRQQTLRATIDWSYELLPPNERTLLTHLSVFAGGWTLGAAEQVACGDPQHGASVLDLLTHLVDKSLVIMESRGDEARYHLLETIRQYALEKLIEAGEHERVQQMHLDFFVRMAAAAEPHLRDATQIEWLDRLQTEHDNLRAALDAALSHGHALAALQLAGSLARFWYLRGYWSEGRDWLGRALAAAPADSGDVELDGARARALYGAGWLADESKTDARYYAESLALCRAVHDEWGMAFALRGLGVATAREDLARADVLLRESDEHFRAVEDEWGVALVRFNQGWLAAERDEPARADVAWREGLQLFEQSGDRWGIAVTRGALSYLARLHGDFKRATKLSKESLALFKALGDKAGMASSLTRLANVAFRRDEFKQATQLFEESINLQRELGYERDTADTYAILGLIAGYRGEFEHAHTLLARSLTLWRRFGDRMGLAQAQHHQALVLWMQGNTREAAALWRECLQTFRANPFRMGVGAARGGLGRAALETGDFAAAAQALGEALAVHRELGDKQYIASSLHNLGRLALAQNDLAQAQALLRESVTLRRESSARRGLAESLEGLAACAHAMAQPERAARLYGAAHVLRAAIGAPLPPVERAEQEENYAALRAQLGTEMFAAAHTAGEAQSLEQAVAFALK